jgi:hypothetical protein
LCFFFIRKGGDGGRKGAVIKKVRLVCEKDREAESIIEMNKRGNFENLVCGTEIEIKIGRMLHTQIL